MLIRLADISFYTAIKALGTITRFEVRGSEHLAEIEAAGKLPIGSFWHNRILLGTYFFRNKGIVVMTSQSFDGEYIARFIQRFGYGSIRGSSTRGGSRALVEMIKLMRAGHAMGITVDGPKGPRYEVKPGPIMLARKTGNPLLPFLVEPRRFRTVKSWDKMQVPLPFTPALVVIGKPIYVSADANDEEMEAKRMELQASLEDLTRQGEEWRKSS
ncbi:MAG: lysophospholipid acyltransferase family protein [Pyrinomonadaceae bacterium]